MQSSITQSCWTPSWRPSIYQIPSHSQKLNIPSKNFRKHTLEAQRLFVIRDVDQDYSGTAFLFIFFKEYLCKVTFYHRNLSWQDKDTLENIPNSMLRSVVLPQEEQNATLYYLTVLTEVQQSAFKPLIGVLWKLSQKLVLSRAQHHSLQPTYTLTCLKPAQKQSCKRAQDLSGR